MRDVSSGAASADDSHEPAYLIRIGSSLRRASRGVRSADSSHGSSGDKILGLAVIATVLVIVVVVTARTEGGRPKDRREGPPFHAADR